MRARLAVASQGAPQDELGQLGVVSGRAELLRELRQQLGQLLLEARLDALQDQRIRELETPLDARLRGIRPHPGGGSAPRRRAAQELQCADEETLPGPGLAGQGVQPGSELDLGRFDQRQITDDELGEHAGRIPLARAGFKRSGNLRAG